MEIFITLSDITIFDPSVRNFSKMAVNSESVLALHLLCLFVGRHLIYFFICFTVKCLIMQKNV